MDFVTANITLALIVQINSDPNLTDKQKVALTRKVLITGHEASIAA